MSNWISSKLKVAESLLQQFDQQAAESLGKNEKSRSDELDNDPPAKPREILPLKDQLKKKTPENSDFVGKLRNDNTLRVNNNRDDLDQNKEVGMGVNVKPKSGLTDSDWTELLSAAPSKTKSGGNGVVWGLRNGGRRQGRSGLNLSALEGKRSQEALNRVSKGSPKLDVLLESKVNGGGLDGRRSDVEDVRFSDSTQSSVELQGESENLERRQLDAQDASGSIAMDNDSGLNLKRYDKLGSPRDGGKVDSRDEFVGDASLLKDENRSSFKESASGTEVSDSKTGLNDDRNRFRRAMGRLHEGDAGPRSSASTRTGSLSASDVGSDSETDSDSTSDSEREREREEWRRRREQILAEKAAAKAVDAIKERENLVARLEGEKQSLEKILEERAKQQAQEASELQMTMMETMDAVDLEKQKHNNTRMEAIARLAKLETANADLSRSLATAQWNLEVKVNRVVEIRQQIDMKEASHEELRRKIFRSHQTGNKLVASKGVEFEHEILEAEYNFVTDKVGRLQEKAKSLEASIEMTRNEMENPTDVEIELKRRLGQLTDHLIQKQAQVEALSSEKATLQFRIESVSRLLDENKSMLNMTDHPRNDLESGIWELSNSRMKPLFEERLRSGQKHLGSLVRQLDSIFSAGVIFLRRNPTAKKWSVIYIVCLHLWVLYILMSHSPVSEEARSGAVFSLENINNTGGV